MMGIRIMRATVPDARRIYAIMKPFTEVGLLQPRAISEISETIRDYFVAIDEG